MEKKMPKVEAELDIYVGLEPSEIHTALKAIKEFRNKNRRTTFKLNIYFEAPQSATAYFNRYRALGDLLSKLNNYSLFNEYTKIGFTKIDLTSICDFEADFTMFAHDLLHTRVGFFTQVKYDTAAWNIEPAKEEDGKLSTLFILTASNPAKLLEWEDDDALGGSYTDVDGAFLYIPVASICEMELYNF